MPKVFISHSHEDRAAVEREIVSLLRRNGIESWYSSDDIQTAADWERIIRDGLRECDWFLLVMSPNSARSDWVRTEVHWALEERPDRFVPVLLASCEPTDFHLKLRRIQHVDFRSNLESARAKL